MPLADRRSEYSWGRTLLADVKVVADRSAYAVDEVVGVTLGFRVIGGLRESFIPDVWTMAWEDNDKLVRLMMDGWVERQGTIGKRLAATGREVRKARFYWSRDPDLPYRIWPAIIHEEGGAPIVPTGVEEAKSRLFDVVKRLSFPASSLGRGTHKVVGRISVGWGRRVYIEKGRADARTKEIELRIE